MKTNNYPNWLVPIDIAKKLKEIGFNTNAVFFYNEEEKPKVMFGLNTFEEVNGQSDLDIEQLNFFQEADMESYECILPTWEQVLEWFREKNLIVTIECEDFYPDDKTYYYAYCIINKLGKVLFYSPNYKSYETYEEVREALVNKLIEIYKSENNTVC